MLTIAIEFKPTDRIGSENGIIAAPSKMQVDISSKQKIWETYGDEGIAKIWATQILKHRLPNTPCVVLSAKVTVS
jgi:hypothetical protein